ncbi:AAA family ATPase [Niveispirillum sp. KHB5.9]|uniref:AAA family ATPase n=1 Tax=Niveispirillum sp. KHB5.9 TaxID=3400269 RepID=UPI003A84C8B1
MQRRPHIGITGSAGTGKTSLAADLSRILDLPVRREAMRDRLAAGFDPHAMPRDGHRRMIVGDADDLALDLARGGGLITDRTPLDMAAFWLANGFGLDDPAGTEALLARAVCAMADYSLVVLLPWGERPIAADGVRSTNPWMQLHFQTVLEGLCRRYVAPGRLLVADGKAPPDRLAALVRDRVWG